MRAQRLKTAGLVAVLLIALLLFAFPLLQIGFTLICGWIPAAKRFFQAWTADASSLVYFFAAVTFLVLGVHAFLAWLHRAPFSLENCAAAGASGWRLKWSCCAMGILACLFIAVTSLILSTHQTYWLRKTTTPWFENPARDRIMEIQAVTKVEALLEQENWKTDPVESRFFLIEALDGTLACDLFQPIWVEGGPHLLRAVILVPRQPLRKDAMIRICTPEMDGQREPVKNLLEVLTKFGINSGSSTAPAKRSS